MEPNQGVLNSAFLKEGNYGLLLVLSCGITKHKWYSQPFFTQPSLKKQVPSIELKPYHHRMVWVRMDL